MWSKTVEIRGVKDVGVPRGNQVREARPGTRDQAVAQLDVTRPSLHLDLVLLEVGVLHQLAQLEGGLHHFISSQDAPDVVENTSVVSDGGENSAECLTFEGGWSTWKPGIGLIALKYCHILDVCLETFFNCSRVRRWGPTDPAPNNISRIFASTALPDFLRVIFEDFVHYSTEISLYTIVPNLLNSTRPIAQRIQVVLALGLTCERTPDLIVDLRLNYKPFVYVVKNCRNSWSKKLLKKSRYWVTIHLVSMETYLQYLPDPLSLYECVGQFWNGQCHSSHSAHPMVHWPPYCCA